MPGFRKIGAGVQAILRFWFSNLRSCNLVLLLMEGFMYYAVEMGSGGMIYVPSFINIGSGIHIQTH
jgi:hypothetical protein